MEERNRQWMLLFKGVGFRAKYSDLTPNVVANRLIVRVWNYAERASHWLREFSVSGLTGFA